MAKERSFKGYDDLIDRGIILTENKQRLLNQGGYKTAILSQGSGNFIIKLDTEAIEAFIAEAKSIPEWENFDPNRFYYLNEESLSHDQVIFVSTEDPKDLPNLNSALEKIKKNPYLTRTASYLNAIS